MSPTQGQDLAEVVVGDYAKQLRIVDGHTCSKAYLDVDLPVHFSSLNSYMDWRKLASAPVPASRLIDPEPVYRLNKGIDVACPPERLFKLV